MKTTTPLTHYQLFFEDGGKASLEIPTEPAQEPPDWARLEHYQCRHCPLSAAQSPFCPFALGLVNPLHELTGRQSFDTVRVSIDWHGRHLEQTSTLQRVLSSVIGLIGATSGCPHTRLLSPMAHFHQPFSGSSETLFRALGTYLIGQYLRQQSGLSAHYSSDGLMAIYRALREVNLRMAERLRSAVRAEPSVNGLVLLDVLAAETLENMESPENSLGELFAPYLDDGAEQG
ncbi:conserved hypothetical protein [Pseudomonas sp. 8Z]|uniref:DUF6901 family protein n=1 Tax=Pseudomonas sp. 8Z TaxID=2653166 RepID=UPI0012F0E32B|nr:hypothetical protein [Pseudomonas sp. 8Z]VXC17467.1 conserved hypothetical protein [Pseudomonas sp. 8Z]